MPLNLRHGANYNAAREAVLAGLNAGLTAAAIVGQEMCIRVMGSEGGSVIGRTRTGRNLYAPSPAGRFPGVRTGRLRQSIYATPSTNLRSSFGTNLEYGRRLEEGTKKMAARPWLRRAAEMSKSRMLQVARAKAQEVIRARMAALGGQA